MNGSESDHEKNLRELEKEFRGRPVAEIEAKIKDFDSVTGADQRDLLRRLAEEERAAADKPARQRFDKIYEQAERHHREAKCIAWTAAVISVLSAVAALISAWFAWHPPQPPAGPAPTPPAVTSPSPTSHDQ
jgi:hypothetical protein